MSRQRPSNGSLWWGIAIAMLLLVVLAFVAAMWLVARSTPVSAQGERTVSLPLVAHGFDAQAPSLVTLIDHDTMFVAAAPIPNTCDVFLTYIDRERGNLLYLVRHTKDGLVEVPLPPGVMLAGAAPQDVLPGLKHGSGAPIVVCGRLRVYMNARVEEGGPFVFQMLEMPIPAEPR